MSVPLLFELTESPDETQRALALTLCQVVPFSQDAIVRVIKSLFSREISDPLKLEAASVLATLEGQQVWRMARSLWASEKSTEVKKAFQRAEERARSTTASRKDRLKWGSAGRAAATSNLVREKMWRALRT